MVRNETSPDDISGMAVAAGILTSRGGMTSHAAVVARGMGKVCVCGVNTLVVDYKTNVATMFLLETALGFPEVRCRDQLHLEATLH